MLTEQTNNHHCMDEEARRQAAIEARVKEIEYNMNTYEPPVVPLDFVYGTFISDGMTLMTGWLRENAPQEIQDLFGTIGWAFCYHEEGTRQNGNVSITMNQEASSVVMQGLRAMAGLGKQFW